MTTRVNIWGTAGRIFADRQECQVYLRGTATIPDGYEQGWNVRYTTELTEPVWFYLRGEEYSAQVESFVAQVLAGEPDEHNGFAAAAATDRTIGMMVADVDPGRLDRRRRSPGRAPRSPAKRSLLPPAQEGGVAMDRLLFGDNQFFGVNHMSEEKARAQQLRFQDIGAVIDVLDAAYDEGIHTFMCTTHDRIALVCDHVRANPERYSGVPLLPVHALRPQVRQRGHRERHARRRQALPPRRGLLQRRRPRWPHRWRPRTSRA